MAYSIPDLLAECDWIDVAISSFKSDMALGVNIGPNMTNQNLEKLTFPDASFDIVITSDVMEHIRLDDNAHAEIARILKCCGVYLFTVPHFRHQYENQIRVKIGHPDNPESDEYILEPEYHGDINSEQQLGALSYRAYGLELDDKLKKTGFHVEYTKKDIPNLGILDTELFYCIKE